MDNLGKWRRLVDLESERMSTSADSLLSSGDLSLSIGAHRMLSSLCKGGDVELTDVDKSDIIRLKLQDLDPPSGLMTVCVREVRAMPAGEGYTNVLKKRSAFYNICGSIEMMYTSAFSRILQWKKDAHGAIGTGLEVDKPRKCSRSVCNALETIYTKFGVCNEVYTMYGTATFRSYIQGTVCK